MYPLPAFPASKDHLVTALLTKRPLDDTVDEVWAALKAEPVDASVEKLWAAALEIAEGSRNARDWADQVVTNEERDAGSVREEEWVLDGQEVGEGADEKRKRADREMNTLISVLRFCATGIEPEHQVALPKKR